MRSHHSGFIGWFNKSLISLALWAAIISGKLWTLPLASASGLVWSVFFLHRYAAFCRAFLISPDGPRIAWRQDVWPIQWRIAVSWISTYFTSQLFTPVLFRSAGPAVAGQMGMTNTLANVVMAMSSNWVVTKAPRYGVLVAERKWRELDSSFFRSLFMSLVIGLVLALGAWGLILLLEGLQHPLASRVLPPGPAGVFLIAGVVSSVLSGLSTYLRAHKREPLMGVFLVGSMVIAALALLLAPSYGATGVGAGYLGVLVLLELPITVWIFQRSRARWHASSNDNSESATRAQILSDLDLKS